MNREDQQATEPDAWVRTGVMRAEWVQEGLHVLQVPVGAPLSTPHPRTYP